jgi:hypothetical protein
VYDTLFEATWETLQQFGKKRKSTNGNDSRFTLGAIELASSLALHCPSGGVDKESNGKIVEVMVNFYFSKGFIESFRAKFYENSKPIKYEQIRQDLWKKPWVLPRNHLETQSLWWNIWRYTHKIIHNIDKKDIDTQNVTLIIRIIGGRSTETNDTHTKFIRRFSCIY